jgi:hypothetical protein
MKNVLLVVAPGVDAPAAVAEALARARAAGGTLVALAVVDPEAHARVASALTDQAFVGERVSENLMEALEREHRGLAEEQVRLVRDEAERQGVACVALVEEGDPSEVSRRVAAAHEVGTAVLVAEKRSWAARFLSRRAPAKVPHLPGCQVVVVDA